MTNDNDYANEIYRVTTMLKSLIISIGQDFFKRTWLSVQNPQ